jgi:hypothetical protein
VTSFLLTAVEATSLWVWLAWCYAALAKLFGPLRLTLPRDVWVAVFAEFKPLALPALLVGHVVMCVENGDPWNLARLAGTGWSVACWWVICRNDKDDDDRWKRRRKRLASKVAVVSGRLQVVPAVSRG